MPTISNSNYTIIRDEIKVKKFTCKNCSNVYDKHRTEDKTAYHCDFCNKWYPELWNV